MTNNVDIIRSRYHRLLLINHTILQPNYNDISVVYLYDIQSGYHTIWISYNVNIIQCVYHTMWIS